MPQPSTSEVQQIVCFNCTLQIQLTLHIKCAECQTTVCLPCFQFGAESGKHKRGHNYEIVDPAGDSVSGGEWGPNEESRLLRAVHQFKMGNWGEIVEIMKDVKRRKADDVKEYFDRIFVRGWMGQFAIKKSDWERIKYEMFETGTFDKILKNSSSVSIERLLLIHDAILDSKQELDENDPKLATKLQNILENYVKKCEDGRVSIEYERPKPPSSSLETDLSFDECDPTSDDDSRSSGKKEMMKRIKKEKPDDYYDCLDQEIDSDVDSTPASSVMKRGRRKNSRITRETSSDTEMEDDKSDKEDGNNLYHGLEREDEDEDNGIYDSALEDQDDTIDGEYDTEDETEKKSKKVASTSVRRKKRKRYWNSKKERRLTAYRGKMNRDSKKKEKELAKLTDICPLEEMNELRNALPKLALETRTSGVEKIRLRQDDLAMLGYNVDREEFENEWFNDAEQLISRLILSPASGEKDPIIDIENDIKFARVQNYIRVLGIRKAKRHAILEHEKITEFFNFMMLATVNKQTATEMIETRSEMEKMLTRTQQFLTRDEYKTFSECIEKVEALTDKIGKLQEMQRNGETNLKQMNSTWGKKTNRKKKRKIDVEKKKKAGLEWKKYVRWRHTAVQKN